jgi:serine/threonine-protein kinase RsbW
MPETELARTIDSLEPMFSFLEEHLEQTAVDETTVFWVKLAAEELFTNMVRHSSGGGDLIGIRLEVSEERVDLVLVDFGADPFDPESVPKVDLAASAEERTPGGLGLPIVERVMDRVVYEHENGNLRVSVIKRRKR